MARVCVHADERRKRLKAALMTADLELGSPRVAARDDGVQLASASTGPRLTAAAEAIVCTGDDIPSEPQIVIDGPATSGRADAAATAAAVDGAVAASVTVGVEDHLAIGPARPHQEYIDLAFFTLFWVRYSTLVRLCGTPARSLA